MCLRLSLQCLEESRLYFENATCIPFVFVFVCLLTVPGKGTKSLYMPVANPKWARGVCECFSLLL